MARIIENEKGRRNILLTTDDVLMMVREYQNITKGEEDYEVIRRLLDKKALYIPEEIV